MLSFGQAANETFSSEPEETESFFRGGAAPRPGVTGAGNQTGAIEPGSEGSDMAAAIRRGDQVVFERLDLAEALGIWRHARGRIVGIHDQDEDAATVDVAFEGHAVLERYLPDLFRRVH